MDAECGNVRPFHYYLLTSSAAALPPGGTHGLFPALDLCQRRLQRDKRLAVARAAAHRIRIRHIGVPRRRRRDVDRSGAHPGQRGRPHEFLALLVCGLASVEATRRIDEPQGTLVRDLPTVWCLPIAILLPPFWVLVAPVPLLAFTQWRVHRGVVHRRLFSAAAIGLLTAAHRSSSMPCRRRSAGAALARQRTRSAGPSRSPDATSWHG